MNTNLNDNNKNSKESHKPKSNSKTTITERLSNAAKKFKNSRLFLVFYIVFVILFAIMLLSVLFYKDNDKTASADVQFPSIPPVGEDYYPDSPNPFYLPTVYNGLSFPKSVLVGLGQPHNNIDTSRVPQLIVYFFDSRSTLWDWYSVKSVNVQNGSNNGAQALLTFEGLDGTLCQINYTPLGPDKYQVKNFTINHNVVFSSANYISFVLPNWQLTSAGPLNSLFNVLYNSTRSGFYQTGYDSGYNFGYNVGVNDGVNQQLGKLNPVSYFLEPVSTFLSTPIFGKFSIGSALSVVLFVGVALIFIKMFAGG